MKKYIVLTTYSYDGDYNATAYDTKEGAIEALDSLVGTEIEILSDEDIEEVELIEIRDDYKEILHGDGDKEIYRIITIEL